MFSILEDNEATLNILSTLLNQHIVHPEPV